MNNMEAIPKFDISIKPTTWIVHKTKQFSKMSMPKILLRSSSDPSQILLRSSSDQPQILLRSFTDQKAQPLCLLY